MGRIRRKNHNHKIIKHKYKFLGNLTEVIFRSKKRSLGLIILSLSLFLCSKSFATSYVAQYVGTAIKGSWVKVNTSGPVSLELVPTESGTMAVGKGTISVETNSAAGYKLYLSGINSEPDGYTALYRNGDKSSDKLRSITSAAPSAFSNPGSWGYALAGDGSTDNFSTAPTYNSVLTVGSTTDSTQINSLKWKGIKGDYSFLKSTNTSNENNPENIDIYYGAYANTSSPVGSYYNVIVYTAFVEGGDEIIVSPSLVSDGDTMTISTNIQGLASPIPSDRIQISLYDSTNPEAGIGTCDNISILQDGTVDKPLSFSCTYHADSDTISNTPYDVNVKVDPKGDGVTLSYTNEDSWEYIYTIGDGTMQSFDATACAAAESWDETGKTYSLRDSRDDKYYLVRKLKATADGSQYKCWMVQNLALEGGTEISWQDSDLPEGVTYILPSGVGFEGKFIDYGLLEMYNGTHLDAMLDNQTDNLGAFYGWDVATAEYDIANQQAGVSSDRSICPKNWRLPYADSDFGALIRAYSAWKGQSFANFRYDVWPISFNGHGQDGELKYIGSSAYWWTNGLYTTSIPHMFHAWMEEGNTEEHAHDRREGASIRCVIN